MAHVDKNGMIRGTAGSVIYRSYGKKNLIQGKPRAFKQTQESIKTSAEFGLSSSAAAIIRRAFDPAYLFRDGAAVSRSTRYVYHSIRNSTSAAVGKRDLHDADLSYLNGREFNADSPLADVLRVVPQVLQSAEGKISVVLPDLNTQTDIKKPKWINEQSNKYRIRLTLVAFNFREEYYEHLDIQDIDLDKYDTLSGQTITFNGTINPACILMVSMSLLFYKYVDATQEYILLNCKAFSPCAVIAAFQSSEPADYPQKEIDQSAEGYPAEKDHIHYMGYLGNMLMQGLDYRIDRYARTVSKKRSPFNSPPAIVLGERISFARE